MKIGTPKAFISYCWSSPGHCDLIRTYAERLVNDGVDVVLDQWELAEGQDKYVFMEKMVTDPSVTHVVIFSDQMYSDKADGRKGGVGTESQIISREVYEKVDQKKFIPVVCQRQEVGDREPCLPLFLRSRIWIDFSTLETVNENWEKLLRALYGKPVYEKPSLGKPPSYLLSEDGRPALPTLGKFASLRTALMDSKPTISLCRADFTDSVIAYADALRVRRRPEAENIDDAVLDVLHKLMPLRDQIIDWLQLEARLTKSPDFERILLDFLERILALKYRPTEVTQWSDAWFDGHGIFAYEVFLYTIAVLLSAERVEAVRELLESHYLLPGSESGRGRDFAVFDEFGGYSRALEARNERLQLRRLSPVADLIKERATREDVSFRDVMEADLLVFLVAVLSDAMRWYPQTLVYSGRADVRFPFFIRAAQHKNFEKLKIITGLNSGDELRAKFKEGCQRHGTDRWSKLTFYADVSFSSSLNLEALDTLK